MVLESPSTVRTSFPISRFGRKSMYGYLRLDGLISSSWIFSRARFLEVACLDLEALALNREIKSCKFFDLFFFFLVSFFHLTDEELAGFIPEIIVSGIELDLTVINICNLCTYFIQENNGHGIRR